MGRTCAYRCWLTRRRLVWVIMREAVCVHELDARSWALGDWEGLWLRGEVQLSTNFLRTWVSRPRMVRCEWEGGEEGTRGGENVVRWRKKAVRERTGKRSGQRKSRERE